MKLKLYIQLCEILIVLILISTILNLVYVSFLFYRAGAYEFFIRNINSCRGVLDIYRVTWLCGHGIEGEAYRLEKNCTTLDRKSIERLIEIYQITLKTSVEDIVNPKIAVILLALPLAFCYVTIIIIEKMKSKCGSESGENG